VGDKIEINYRHERAFFQVIWVTRQANSSELHVGAESVDRDKISASFAKGVLTIVLPKTATARDEQKKIEVKAG